MRILLENARLSYDETEQALRKWWAGNNTLPFPGLTAALAVMLEEAEFYVTDNYGGITIEAVA